MPIFSCTKSRKVKSFTEQTFWGNVEELTLPLSIADSRDRTLIQTTVENAPNLLACSASTVLHQRYQR